MRSPASPSPPQSLHARSPLPCPFSIPRLTPVWQRSPPNSQGIADFCSKIHRCTGVELHFGGNKPPNWAVRRPWSGDEVLHRQNPAMRCTGNTQPRNDPTQAVPTGFHDELKSAGIARARRASSFSRRSIGPSLATSLPPVQPLAQPDAVLLPCPQLWAHEVNHGNAQAMKLLRQTEMNLGKIDEHGHGGPALAGSHA